MNLLIPIIFPYYVTSPLFISFHSLSHLRATALQVAVVCAAIVREDTCVEFLISFTVH